MIKTQLEAQELKAIRLTLGLNVAEASEICDVTKRTFQYWESGKYSIPADVVDTFTHYAHVYDLVCENMGDDMDAWNAKYPSPVTDDAEEYARLIKQRPKLTMPFYRKIEDFTAATGNPYVFSYRIYQSVVNHYFTLGKIPFLSDGGKIPPEFKQTLFWVTGGYDEDAKEWELT